MEFRLKKVKKADMDPSGNRRGDNDIWKQSAKWDLLRNDVIVARISQDGIHGVWYVLDHKTFKMLLKRTYDTRKQAVQSAIAHFS